MNIKHSVAFILSLGLLTAFPLYADDDDTMVVVDDETEVEDVTKVIALPEDAAQEGKDNSASGLDTANRAREDGRAFGQQQAEEGRSRGQDARENAGENARDNARDNAGDNSDSGADNRPEGIPGL